MRSSPFFNVWLLALCNAIAFSAIPLMMLVGSLVGAELAPSPKWATLPIAAMIVGGAAGILPATQTMQRLGRKAGFWVFLSIGAGSCWLASQALAMQSFTLFCISSALLGLANAAIQQMRFAAMESVPAEKGVTAASIVMCGGIIAAILGPELVIVGQNFSQVEYQGSFWLVGFCFITSAVLLSLLKPVQTNAVARDKSSSRPITQIMRHRGFILAVLSGTVGYMIMSFVMTGTPISMHHHQGYSLLDTKWVIQSHIATMFLPSLVAPLLFRWLGIRGMMAAGLMAYCVTIVIGLNDSSVMGYWSQLVALGIGWNFLFVAGTALLPSTYLPGEQFKAQGFNDVTVFSFQSIGSLSAGWAINMMSWQSTLLICLLPMSILLVALVASRSSQSTQTEAN